MSSESSDMSAREQELNEAIAAYLDAINRGQIPDRDDFLALHPKLATELALFFEDQDRFRPLVSRTCDPQPTADASPISFAEAVTVGPATNDTSPSGVKVRHFGDYELLEEIGRGGMGVVYKARQISLNRVVALKMILAGQLASPSGVRRFQKEAEATANLDHPNIVPVYEVGEHEGQHYFSMKLIEGGSLAQHLPGLVADHRAAARLMATVARATHHAHQRGILHRDLKPGNILLDSRHEPHVSDFGLAKRVEVESSLTTPGLPIGTPSYMPPEQARGEKVLTTSADVYSLGAVLYEMLTGRPPFRAATPLDTVLEVLTRDPPSPRSLDRRVDRDLETICLKCLEKSLPRRYGSAEALAEDMERWLRGEPILARRTNVWERTVKWAWRRPSVAALTASVLLTAVLGFVGVAWKWQEAESAKADALHKAAAELEAQKAAALALEQKEIALHFNLLLSAKREWQSNNVGRAEELLGQCSESLRNWEWYYLKRLCHADLLTLPNILPLPNITTEHGRMSFASGGRGIVISHFRDVIMWDIATARRTLVLQQSSGENRALSPNSDRLLCYLPQEKRLEVRSVATGERTASFEDAQRPSAAVFSLNGQLIATLDNSGAQVRDLGDGKATLVLPVLASTSPCLDFSADGKRLAIAASRTVKVWDVASGKQIQVIPRPRLHGSVALSPDGRQLASANSDDNTLGLWDLASGKELHTLRGHSGPVNDCAFSPDGRRLASASDDKSLKLWDTSTGHEIRSFRGHSAKVQAVIFDPDGQRLASRGRDGTVKVWDANADQEAVVVRVPASVRGAMTGFAFSADGAHLVTANADQSTAFWEVASGRRTRTVSGPIIFEQILGGSRTASATFGSVSSSTDYVYHSRDASVSEDGKFVATILGDGLQVRSAETGRKRRQFGGYTGTVMSVALSPNGDYVALATRSFDPIGSQKSNLVTIGGRWAYRVYIWDVSTGQSLAAPSPISEGIHSLAFAPGCRRLASAGDDGSLGIWDCATGQSLVMGRTNGSAVGTTAFSSDGKWLASGSADGSVRIWDAWTGKVTLSLRGHVRAITALAFTPDARRLASTDDEGVLKLFDTHSGEEALMLQAHSAAVEDTRFSPDGKRLATSNGGEVKIWDGSPLQENLNPRPD